MEKIKDKILEDAIRTALAQKRVIDIQKGIIVAMVGTITFLLCKGV